MEKSNNYNDEALQEFKTIIEEKLPKLKKTWNLFAVPI